MALAELRQLFYYWTAVIWQHWQNYVTVDHVQEKNVSQMVCGRMAGKVRPSEKRNLSYVLC
jgi:hypothetical protein